MNRDEKVHEIDLEAEEVSQQDVKYLADEEGYSGVRETHIEDEGEAWSMLGTEG